MAVNGFTDLCATVSVPKSEYEELIRESNTLRIATNYVEDIDYIDKKTIRLILGISKESEE